MVFLKVVESKSIIVISLNNISSINGGGFFGGGFLNLWVSGWQGVGFWVVGSWVSGW